MVKVDSRDGLDEELKKNDRVLALFYASWCPYCRAFLPKFDEKIGKINSATVLYVILDDYDNPLWDDFDVEAVPTVIYFEKNKVSKRLDGRFGVGLKADQLTRWLSENGLAGT